MRRTLVPETIIVPLDGSESAERALGVAAAVAGKTGAAVVVVTASQGGVVVEPKTYLTQAAAAVGIANPRPVVVDDRLAASAIILVASEADDPLVCMATHARGGPGHAVFGSVAEETLRRVPTPILLVGPQVPPGVPELAHLVVGIDGSAYSTAILTIATSFAVALGLDVTLVTVVDPETQRAGGPSPSNSPELANLKQLGGRLEGDCGAVACEVLAASDVADAIVEFAGQRPGTVIALTSHGRTGLARITIGSVTMAVVRDATCPVLTVRPPGLGSS
jgi:nucleotide-binding universal stress UspA family protein